ncbi:XcbB/CpsF family capsular polysaccharide biosynthesis protein [Listeria fleischmannii]|jgi:accessory secretory protein Asp2|uniref:XcbB/CpsF family capsular polysaccharide biosynthesis protein n=1 Tax=Listeria fleischmannii TaxID=1069827 RepID=A0A841YCE1_9LIST|nr:XcbB/CpsF family capsular polysaccharide biosynthesis protein [Listeria fleischmannii]EIA19285.1 hypothetical protein KKC_13210 [Listeria fleischmannii subsp. coloradonensis]MBC1397869.1 XcbB/CpsF family capsular polysaccharide biosynthesis protein [Listeria fleischmannii]MBC1417474.1 XcbB/CpsF family capsular polysaccharide biosynthesis protein [Listeria fleischmannii]MBC1427366.1 XcbB/CpsF family capsular polysaccharide biosynthesis protein [Listeria fleischmannii]STY33960.1 Uncharacteris
MTTNKDIEFTDIYNFQCEYGRKKLVIKTFSDKNILELSRETQPILEMYKAILAHDYVLYMHAGQSSYFIRRKDVHTIWQRKDLIQHGALFYSLEKIPPEKENKLAPKRLVVIFSPMPAKENYYSANIAHRCFTTSFASMQKHLVKNTIIMRIMDLNLSYGSHYINTFNYMEMESDVQSAIQFVMQSNHIVKEDVVLYGGSKGGTGALYHSFLGDFNSVTVDPIISTEQYNQENDLHYLRDFRKRSILNDLMALSNKETSTKKIIFGYPLVSFNYNLYNQLSSNSVEIHNVFDSSVHKHADISRHTVIEQITWINKLLLSSNNLHKIEEQLHVLTE